MKVRVLFKHATFRLAMKSPWLIFSKQRRFNAISFGLALAVTCAFQGCRTRSTNEVSKEKSVTSLKSSVEMPLPIPGIELINDDPAFPVTDTPPMDYSIGTPKEVLSLELDVPYGVGIKKGVSALVFPIAFEKKVLAASRAPVPLAASSVLKALEAIRKAYWTKGPGVPSSRATLTDEETRFYTDVTDTSKGNWNFNSCLLNAADHWSDIQFHYYCAMPATARACYRSVVVEAADIPPSGQPAGGVTPQNNRVAALDVCLGYGKTNDPEVDDWINTKMWMVDIRDRKLTVKSFQDFYETQWLDSLSGSRVNMFRYIMLSDTYAFDFAQQQAVLNVFYATMAGHWDPSFFYQPSASCKRPAFDREILPNNEVPDNQCRADKLLLRPLAGIGR